MLVVVRTVTAANRLVDALCLLENDRRVQVVFTYDDEKPAIFTAGVHEFLQQLRAPVIPWQQALATSFDLVLAASENDDLHRLCGPVLLIAHGIGYQKYYPGREVIAGLDPARLGRSTVLALSHVDQRELVRAACPEAAERAVVIGDPCHDRMLASRHRAAEYRAALGAVDKTLVVVASTWGPDSVFGRDPGLVERLVGELPVDEFAVCAILHPGVVSAHSAWQVRAWLANATDAGLHVLPPEAGWQAAILSASCVVSDRGSLALYAASMDLPLLLVGGPSATTVPGSPMAALAAQTARLDDRDLAVQIRLAIRRHTAGAHELAVKQAVGDPGRSAELLRPVLYRMMDLPEPPTTAEFPPINPAAPRVTEVSAFVVGLRDGALQRFPSTTHSHELDHRHLVAHATTATLRQVTNAAILYRRLDEHEQWRFTAWAAETLRQWPNARLVAATLGDRTCLVRIRAGGTYRITVERTAADALMFASLAYIRLQDCELSTMEHVRVGGRTVSATVRAL